MRRKHLSLLASASLCGVLIQAGLLPTSARAQVLNGQVTSTEEGNMEGVLVSAKKDGGTVTVTVVSDAKGQYGFPAGRLTAGKYTISARAAGYDLVGPKTAHERAVAGREDSLATGRRECTDGARSRLPPAARHRSTLVAAGSQHKYPERFVRHVSMVPVRVRRFSRLAGSHSAHMPTGRTRTESSEPIGCPRTESSETGVMNCHFSLSRIAICASG